MKHSDRQGFLTDKITLFLSGEHPCSYLSGNTSQEIYAQPLTRFNNHIYSQLIYSGFRRSGELVYRPHCKQCTACIPVRVPVQQFASSTSQRRVWKKNAAINVIKRPAVFSPEHFSLYTYYVNERHPNGGMDNPEPREYMEMLTCHWTQTEFVEFWLGAALVGVAVMDKLEDGYSAVYTFYNPDLDKQSLGTFIILWQIMETRALGLSHLYLGYLIEDCAKMNYKNRFRPFEQYVDNRWELQTRETL